MPQQRKKPICTRENGISAAFAFVTLAAAAGAYYIPISVVRIMCISAGVISFSLIPPPGEGPDEENREESDEEDERGMESDNEVESDEENSPGYIPPPFR